MCFKYMFETRIKGLNGLNAIKRPHKVGLQLSFVSALIHFSVAESGNLSLHLDKTSSSQFGH